MFSTAWFCFKCDGDTLMDYLVKMNCNLVAIDCGLVSVKVFSEHFPFNDLHTADCDKKVGTVSTVQTFICD